MTCRHFPENVLSLSPSEGTIISPSPRPTDFQKKISKDKQCRSQPGFYRKALLKNAQFYAYR
jgi:hypothetical protein